MTNDPVPASPEILAHHLDLHRRSCPATDFHVHECECERAIGFYCDDCHARLFIGIQPGDEPCDHALAALAVPEPIALMWGGAA